jgi:hypothetical protein
MTTMNTPTLIGILVIALVVFGLGVFLLRDMPNDDVDLLPLNDTVHDELTTTEGALDRLPYEFNVHERMITLDRYSVPATNREEYAQLPYTIEIGDETRLVETDISLLPGEGPIEFIERVAQERMPTQETLEQYPDTLYSLSASLHPMPETHVRNYPITDDPDADPAQEGISAYVRMMNIPDDSVGGSEERYDFIVTESGSWLLVWIGERTHCRRPDQEFWQPADQLCP